MSKKFKQFMKKQGFTLVELIIVIAVISILAIAAFMMLTKWLANSRDSRRLADLGTIKKALEIDYTVLWYYPEPDDKKAVLDSEGNQMWYIGVIGNEVIKKIDSMVIVPEDPSDGSYFNYATTLNKKEFQVWVLLEKWETAMNWLEKVYAFETVIDPVTKVVQRKFTQEDLWAYNTDIDGRYDGFVWYSTGDNKYIVRTESLLVYTGNTLVTSGTVNNLMLDKKPLWEPTVVRDLKITPTMSNDIIIVKAKEELWLTGGNIDGDSKAIEIVKRETNTELEPIQYNHCELDGTLIAHGDSIDTYSATTVPFGNSCEDIKTTRTCDDGTLSAWPDYQICNVEAASNCELNGTTIAHGDSINAYSEANIAWDASYDCTDRVQTRTCYNGTLDGSYTNLVCAKGTPANCNANPTYNYSGHTYNVVALDHGNSATPTVEVNENNGVYRYTLNVTCNNGTYNESETGPVLVSCDTHYTASGINCLADSRTVNCGWTLPENAEWNTSNTYSQTWNGSAWAPTKIANYNTTTSVDDCRYRCKNTYHTEDSGTSCVPNTRTCTITNGAWSQTWNGSSWNACVPTSCNTDYYKNGNSCIWVGNGYYSLNGSLIRSVCTNKSPWQTYTWSWNWTHNCPVCTPTIPSSISPSWTFVEWNQLCIYSQRKSYTDNCGWVFVLKNNNCYPPYAITSGNPPNIVNSNCVASTPSSSITWTWRANRSDNNWTACSSSGPRFCHAGYGNIKNCWQDNWRHFDTVSCYRKLCK